MSLCVVLQGLERLLPEDKKDQVRMALRKRSISEAEDDRGGRTKEQETRKAKSLPPPPPPPPPRTRT